MWFHETEIRDIYLYFNYLLLVLFIFRYWFLCQIHPQVSASQLYSHWELRLPGKLFCCFMPGVLFHWKSHPKFSKAQPLPTDIYLCILQMDYNIISYPWCYSFYSSLLEIQTCAQWEILLDFFLFENQLNGYHFGLSKSVTPTQIKMFRIYNKQAWKGFRPSSAM